MYFSKAFYELFERNFRALSEKFEDSIHDVAKAYSGFHMNNPFMDHFFPKHETHEKEHVHGIEKKVEMQNKTRKNP